MLRRGAVDASKYFLSAIGIDESFESVFRVCRQALPMEVMGWVTDSVIPGLAHCWGQLFDLSGGAQAVVDLEVPVVLWAGEEDAYYRPMLSFAQQITSTSYQWQAIMPFSVDLRDE